jgi:hypothetical protein
MEEVQPRRRVRRRPAFAVVIRYGQVDVGTRARAAAPEARGLGPRGALLATGAGVVGAVRTGLSHYGVS